MVVVSAVALGLPYDTTFGPVYSLRGYLWQLLQTLRAVLTSVYLRRVVYYLDVDWGMVNLDWVVVFAQHSFFTTLKGHWYFSKH